MNKRYNIQNVRSLLESFSLGQVRNIASQLSGFKLNYESLLEKGSKEELIAELLGYVEKHLQIEILLTLSREQNPAKYETLQPYYIPPSELKSSTTLQPRRYFSVGTALYQSISPEAKLIADSVLWLLQQRNEDGTWGGDDSLDRFITTNHTVMALMAVGFSPKSPILANAIDYLVNIDKDTIVSFFWRAGTLLNIPDYVHVVQSDMEYLWQYRKRVGVHKDYPVPFFLLKLTRFIQPKPQLSFNENDVLKWVIEEWDEKVCWYKRTSITSMALAIIFDLKFKNKAKVVTRTNQFLEENFTEIGNGVGCFSGHLVDDSFLVFNLCETDFFEKNGDPTLWEMTKKTVRWIESQCIDQKHWEGPPPFGGNIGPKIYPTAVAIRSLASYYIRVYPNFISQISSTLVEQEYNNNQKLEEQANSLAPFWGAATTEETDTCFVLMPFQPIKLTEIYQRYIKEPIEAQTGLRCVRADDIYQSSEIMRDIWEHMNKAKLVIADMTSKNPNVFYELGMAHVLGKKVILISQTIDDVPFDLRGVRTITYEDRISGYEHLGRQVVMFVQNILKESK